MYNGIYPLIIHNLWYYKWLNMGLWINDIIKNTIKQSFIIWLLMNPIASKLTKTEPGIDVAHLDDPHGGQLLMSPCTILGVEVAIRGTNPTCLNAKSIHIEIQRSILMNVHALMVLNLSTGVINIYIYIPGKPKTQNFLVIMGKSRNEHFCW